MVKGAKFILLYKATTHGDKASVFHEKCDKCPMSLVLIETDKGARFGGFTTKTWEGHCEKKIDNDAFVFNTGYIKQIDNKNAENELKSNFEINCENNIYYIITTFHLILFVSHPTLF